MRLLLLTTERGFRGGEVQLVLCAAELAARGHELHLAGPPGAELWARLTGSMVRHELRARNDLDLLAARRLRGLIARVRPDLVHAFTPRAQAIARLASRRGVPLVASRLVGVPAGKGLGGRLKYRGIAGYAAVSRDAAAALTGAGVLEACVRIVPSAVGPAFRPRAAAPSATAVVGCVAALVPGKGQAELLRAAASLASSLPGLELRLIGAGPERARLEGLAASLGLAGRVRFPGQLGSPEAVAAALAELDVFALASEGEGLPTAILEAMAVGVPVAATAVGGVPEIVRDGKSGLLVPPRNGAALAAALAELLSRPELRARLAAGGRAVAEAHSVGRVVDALEALYAAVR
ncbi:MAG: glycosyltransferase [Myxococcales bacterium]